MFLSVIQWSGPYSFNFCFMHLTKCIVLSWFECCDRQLHALEENAESLRERCQRFYKGCRKYTYDYQPWPLQALFPQSPFACVSISLCFKFSNCITQLWASRCRESWDASKQGFSTTLKSSYGLWCCRDGLGDACDGDIAFANALETFGGGHDDPISVAVGGSSSILAACYNL